MYRVGNVGTSAGVLYGSLGKYWYAPFRLSLPIRGLTQRYAGRPDVFIKRRSSEDCCNTSYHGRVTQAYDSMYPT